MRRLCGGYAEVAVLQRLHTKKIYVEAVRRFCGGYICGSDPPFCMKCILCRSYAVVLVLQLGSVGNPCYAEVMRKLGAVQLVPRDAEERARLPFAKSGLKPPSKIPT